MKICTVCQLTKDLKQFNFSNKSKNIRGAKCKACVKIQRLKYKHKQKEYDTRRKIEGILLTRERARLWHKNNKALSSFNSMQYYTRKLNATPKWLTEEHIDEIKQFYIDAEYLTHLTKVKFHVDHIMPLKGETLCGLHVPWNLQLLPANENCSKSNKIIS